MYLWLQIFLLATGITARLIIPASTAGSGLNLLVNIFIWLAFFIYLLEKVHFVRNHLPGNTSESRSLGWTPPILKVLLFVFVILIIMAFLRAPYKFGAFTYLSAWTTDILLFYLIYQLCIQHSQQMILFTMLFLSNALIITFSALHQHLKGLKDLFSEIQQNPQLLNNIPVELRDAFWGRISAAEPFATFIYQNSLGAFLVLVIPLVLVIFLFIKKPLSPTNQHPKQNYLGRIIFRLVLLIITVLMSFILIKTGSKGALVSFIVSVIIIFILNLKLSKPVKIILLIGTIILFLFLFSLTLNIILSSDTPQWVESISNSLTVRFDYWRAAAKIIKNNIWNGSGLNQFGAEYLYYKSYQAGETTKAHNDYLQIASETGLPALIIFILIWFIILKSIIYPPRQQLEKPLEKGCLPKSTLSPFISGTAFAFIISEIFQTPLIAVSIPYLSTLILYIIWLIVFWFFSTYLTSVDSYSTNPDGSFPRPRGVSGREPRRAKRGPETGNIKPLRIALFAGILGFLLHCTIDFNFYVQGLSMSIWFIGAVFLSTTDLTLITGQQTTNYKLRLKNLIKPLFILLIALILVILCIVTPRLIQYESLLEQGKTFVRSDNKEERSSAIDYLKNAYRLNPYAVDPLLELAWAYHYNYCLPPPDKVDLTSINNNHCLEYIHNAIKLSPLSSMLYYQEGLLYQQHADYLNKICKDFVTDPGKRKTFEKMVDLYRQRAILSFKMTQELYPTFSPAGGVSPKADNKK
jgi:O-antigen ligase